MKETRHYPSFMTTSLRNIVRFAPLPLPQRVVAWANTLPPDISMYHNPQYEAMLAEIAAAREQAEAENFRLQLRKEGIDL